MSANPVTPEMSEDNEITTACTNELNTALGASPDDLALLCRSRSTVVSEFAGKGTGELKAEFKVYAKYDDQLRDHHANARDMFVANHAIYKQMFSRIELLNQLAQFEFLGATPEDRDDFSIIWDGVMGTVGDSVGAAVSIGGIIYSVHRYYKMGKLAKGGATVGAADDAIAGVAKMAKTSRAIAVGGGVFSLAMAALTIASAVKNEVEYHAALETDLGKYADWYAQTRENAILFCYWAKTMRKEITELKLNLVNNADMSDEEFLTKLEGFMIQAGELEAQVRLATRMLCGGLEPSTVETYTDLDIRIINNIKGRIDVTGSTVCQDVGVS